MATSRRWYFIKEQLDDSPSRKKGIPSDKEILYRVTAANLIHDIGNKLELTSHCTLTAIVYMHRFYMYHSFTSFHRYAIAIACVYLATKVEEQPYSMSNVIKVAHRCITGRRPPKVIKSGAFNDLCFNEHMLVQTLGFEFTIEHPHAYIINGCKLVGAGRDLTKAACVIATTSLLLTTMCIKHKPTKVACFCMHYACKWTNWRFPKSSEGKDWFSYIDKFVAESELDDMIDEFLLMYDKFPSKLKTLILHVRGDLSHKRKDDAMFPNLSTFQRQSINTPSTSQVGFSNIPCPLAEISNFPSTSKEEFSSKFLSKADSSLTKSSYSSGSSNTYSKEEFRAPFTSQHSYLNTRISNIGHPKFPFSSKNVPEKTRLPKAGLSSVQSNFENVQFDRDSSKERKSVIPPTRVNQHAKTPFTKKGDSQSHISKTGNTRDLYSSERGFVNSRAYKIGPPNIPFTSRSVTSKNQTSRLQPTNVPSNSQSRLSDSGPSSDANLRKKNLSYSLTSKSGHSYAPFTTRASSSNTSVSGAPSSNILRPSASKVSNVPTSSRALPSFRKSTAQTSYKTASSVLRDDILHIPSILRKQTSDIGSSTSAENISSLPSEPDIFRVGKLYTPFTSSAEYLNVSSSSECLSSSIASSSGVRRSNVSSIPRKKLHIPSYARRGDTLLNLSDNSSTENETHIHKVPDVHKSLSSRTVRKDSNNYQEHKRTTVSSQPKLKLICRIPRSGIKVPTSKMTTLPRENLISEKNAHTSPRPSKDSKDMSKPKNKSSKKKKKIKRKSPRSSNQDTSAHQRQDNESFGVESSQKPTLQTTVDIVTTAHAAHRSIKNKNRKYQKSSGTKVPETSSTNTNTVLQADYMLPGNMTQKKKNKGGSTRSCSTSSSKARSNSGKMKSVRGKPSVSLTKRNAYASIYDDVVPNSSSCGQLTHPKPKPSIFSPVSESTVSSSSSGTEYRETKKHIEKSSNAFNIKVAQSITGTKPKMLWIRHLSDSDSDYNEPHTSHSQVRNTGTKMDVFLSKIAYELRLSTSSDSSNSDRDKTHKIDTTLAISSCKALRNAETLASFHEETDSESQLENQTLPNTKLSAHKQSAYTSSTYSKSRSCIDISLRVHSSLYKKTMESSENTSLAGNYVSNSKTTSPQAPESATSQIFPNKKAFVTSVEETTQRTCEKYDNVTSHENLTGRETLPFENQVQGIDSTKNVYSNKALQGRIQYQGIKPTIDNNDVLLAQVQQLLTIENICHDNSYLSQNQDMNSSAAISALDENILDSRDLRSIQDILGKTNPEFQAPKLKPREDTSMQSDIMDINFETNKTIFDDILNDDEKQAIAEAFSEIVTQDAECNIFQIISVEDDILTKVNYMDTSEIICKDHDTQNILQEGEFSGTISGTNKTLTQIQETKRSKTSFCNESENIRPDKEMGTFYTDDDFLADLELDNIDTLGNEDAILDSLVQKLDKMEETSGKSSCDLKTCPVSDEALPSPYASSTNINHQRSVEGDTCFSIKESVASHGSDILNIPDSNPHHFEKSGKIDNVSFEFLTNQLIFTEGGRDKNMQSNVIATPDKQQMIEISSAQYEGDDKHLNYTKTGCEKITCTLQFPPLFKDLEEGCLAMEFTPQESRQIRENILSFTEQQLSLCQIQASSSSNSASTTSKISSHSSLPVKKLPVRSANSPIRSNVEQQSRTKTVCSKSNISENYDKNNTSQPKSLVVKESSNILCPSVDKDRSFAQLLATKTSGKPLKAIVIRPPKSASKPHCDRRLADSKSKKELQLTFDHEKQRKRSVYTQNIAKIEPSMRASSSNMEKLPNIPNKDFQNPGILCKNSGDSFKLIVDNSKDKSNFVFGSLSELEVKNTLQTRFVKLETQSKNTSGSARQSLLKRTSRVEDDVNRSIYPRAGMVESGKSRCYTGQSILRPVPPKTAKILQGAICSTASYPSTSKTNEISYAKSGSKVKCIRPETKVAHNVSNTGEQHKSVKNIELIGSTKHKRIIADEAAKISKSSLSVHPNMKDINMFPPGMTRPKDISAHKYSHQQSMLRCEMSNTVRSSDSKELQNINESRMVSAGTSSSSQRCASTYGTFTTVPNLQPNLLQGNTSQTYASTSSTNVPYNKLPTSTYHQVAAKNINIIQCTPVEITTSEDELD